MATGLVGCKPAQTPIIETDMTQCSKEAYAAAIPACCEYQGLETHITALGLCWGLIRAVEAGKPMDCRGCALNTRPVFARSRHNGNEG